MLADGDLDEAARVVKMFADGRFNYRLSDFPRGMWEAVSDSRPHRRYAALLAEVGTAAGSTFGIAEIGSVEHDAQTYPLVKLVTKPPASPYATRLPICMVAGVHGDEPDGVLSALEFARRFARSPDL